MEKTDPRSTSSCQDIALLRVQQALQTFDGVALCHVDKFQEEDPEELRLHVTSHLLTALKSCLRGSRDDTCVDIIKFLVEHKQCNMCFIWQMIMALLHKNSSNYSFLIPDLVSVFTNRSMKKFHHDEAYLVNTIYQINQGNFDRALQDASKSDGRHAGQLFNKGSSSIIAASASSNFLIGYRTLLESLNINPDDKEAIYFLKDSLEGLISKNMFLPLFADAYIFVLSTLGLRTEAEQFIYRLIDQECVGNIGTHILTFALELVELHIRNANPKLVQHLLEMISERDPGHIKVVELCRNYLHVPQYSRSRRHSDTESQMDFGSDEDTVVESSKLTIDHLSKCLELIASFLDAYVHHPVIAPVKEGWNILGDVLRRICLKGTDANVVTVVNVWHNDRRRWWPCFHSSTMEISCDNEFLANKGLACFLLESDSHPFVISVLESKSGLLLKSFISQLRESKSKLDARIAKVLSSRKPKKTISLKQVTISSNTTSQQEKFHSSLVFAKVDSERLARDFTQHIANSCPVRKREDYRTKPVSRPDTLEMYELPMEDRLTKRYEKRRSAPLRSKESYSYTNCSSHEDGLVSEATSLSESCVDSEFPDDTTFVPKSHTVRLLQPDKTLVPRLRSSSQPEVDRQLSEDELPAASLEVNPSLKKKQERWTGFLADGTWEVLSSESCSVDSNEDVSSESCSVDSDEYDSDGQSSYYHDSPTTDSEDDRQSFSNAWRKKEQFKDFQAEQPEATPPNFTPDLALPETCIRTKEVIPNEERYAFFGLDDTGVSACSSSTEEITQSISQALKRLDDDATLFAQFSPSRYDNEVDEYVMEAELPDETSRQDANISTSLFFRRVEVSSPDMCDASSGEEGEKTTGTEIEKPIEVDLPRKKGMKAKSWEIDSSTVIETGSLEKAAASPISVAPSQLLQFLNPIAEQIISSGNERNDVEKLQSPDASRKIDHSNVRIVDQLFEGNENASSSIQVVTKEKKPVKTKKSLMLSKPLDSDLSISQDKQSKETLVSIKRGKGTRRIVGPSETDRWNVKLIDQLLKEAENATVHMQAKNDTYSMKPTASFIKKVSPLTISKKNSKKISRGIDLVQLSPVTPKLNEKPSSTRKRKVVAAREIREESRLNEWNIQLVDELISGEDKEKTPAIRGNIGMIPLNVSQVAFNNIDEKNATRKVTPGLDKFVVEWAKDAGVAASPQDMQTSTPRLPKANRLPRKGHVRVRNPLFYTDSEDEETDDSPESADLLSKNGNGQIVKTSNKTLKQVKRSRSVLAQMVEESATSSNKTEASATKNTQRKRNSRKQGSVGKLKTAEQSEDKDKDVDALVKDILQKYLAKSDTDVKGKPEKKSRSTTSASTSSKRSNSTDSDVKGKKKDGVSVDEQISEKSLSSKSSGETMKKKRGVKKNEPGHSDIDQVTLNLLDRLLEEQVTGTTGPEVRATSKKSVKRRNSQIEDENSTICRLKRPEKQKKPGGTK